MQATVWNRRFYVTETDPVKVHELFGGILAEAKFGVVCFNEHYFEPQGYTAFWLLSESHFAVHTFPEQGKSYCELASCNLEKFITFVRLVKDLEV